MQVLRDQRSQEWLEARQGKITASLGAAVLSLDPYTGPLSAYNQIVGNTKKSENAYMVHGTNAEPLAITAYEVESGILVSPGGFWVHDSIPYLGASPDVLADEGLAEIKAPQVLPLDIPPHHEIQCRIQMAVCNRPWVDYFAWTPGDHFMVRVQRNDEIERGLLAGLEAFWKQHLLPKIPPSRRRRKSVETEP